MGSQVDPSNQFWIWIGNIQFDNGYTHREKSLLLYITAPHKLSQISRSYCHLEQAAGDETTLSSYCPHSLCYVLCLVTQSCPTLCNPMDCSQPGFSVHGDSPGKNTAVGCHALLQGIFPTQGSNPGIPHCRWILYQLSHSKGNSEQHHSFTLVSVLCKMSQMFERTQLVHES